MTKKGSQGGVAGRRARHAVPARRPRRSPRRCCRIVDVPTHPARSSRSASPAGIEEIIFVTARGKSAHRGPLRSRAELEALLERRGKTADLARCARRPRWRASSRCGRSEARGLGHAVLCARDGGRRRAVRGAAGRRSARRARSRASASSSTVYEQSWGTGVDRAQGGAGGPGAHVRHRRRRARRRPRLAARRQAGREAGAGHGAVAAGDHRALRAAAGDLRRSSPRRRPGAAARSSSPTGWRRCASGAACTAWRSRGERFDVGDRAGYVLAMVHYALQREDIGDDVRAGAQRILQAQEPSEGS